MFNQKGGVGKTTTCVNLCAAFTENGKKALIVDVDPQGHSTSGLGVDKNTVFPSTYNVLIEGTPVEKAIVHTKYGDIVPCNKGLFGSGILLSEVEQREFVLKKALASVKNLYDFILIDCPALLELLTLNALCAADSILIPVQCEYLALEGLSDLMSSIKMVRRSLNPDLEIEGVVLTMFDGRTNLSLQIANEVKKHLKRMVLKTVIPRNVRLSEAPSHGKPVTAYDRGSRGAQAYAELANEILSKNR